MKIVCAESVLYGGEAFGTIGDVAVISDAEIAGADLRNADALVTRSKTRIDRGLIQGSALRFIGTATAGFDHIDTEAMRELGVFWTAAPGCNAVGVAEYVLAALLDLAGLDGFELRGKSIAIVGVGQVGSRVAARAQALGMRVLLNDPPRAEREANELLRPLDELLPVADIISFHTPLTHDGPHPTRAMVNQDVLESLRPGTIFINAARGEIVDESALLAAIDSGIVGRTVLDVWAGEPHCRRDLLERVDIGTPHIAGYSYDGKLRGTAMIYESLCDRLGIAPRWNSEELLPPSPLPRFRFKPRRNDEATVRELVQSIYDIRRDDADLRPSPLPSEAEHARLFNRLRKNYPVRREFSGTAVAIPARNPELEKLIAELGFGCEVED